MQTSCTCNPADIFGTVVGLDPYPWSDWGPTRVPVSNDKHDIKVNRLYFMYFMFSCIDFCSRSGKQGSEWGRLYVE